MSKLELPSAKSLVLEQIRAMLHRGELTMGDRVSIDHLAQQFGVSRTPVREALWQLSAEGLVRIDARVGVFVRYIDWPEVFDVYCVKIQLEPVMAQWAIERSSLAERQDFRDSIVELEDAFAEGSIDRYVEIVETRRERLLQMARSQVLVDTLQVIDGRLRLLRWRNLSREQSRAASLAGHREIAAAVGSEDAKAGFEAMRRHMISASERVRELFERGDAAAVPAPAPD